MWTKAPVLLIALAFAGLVVEALFNQFFQWFLAVTCTVLAVAASISLATLGAVKKNAAELHLPEVERAAELMGISLAKVKSTKLLRGAFFSRGDRTLVIGEECLSFPRDVLMAIVAHELAHGAQTRKVTQLFLKFVLLPACVLFPLLLLLEPAVQGAVGLCFALIYLPLAARRINWELEFDADRAAAELVGVEPLKRALLLISGGKVSSATFLHPPVSVRIAKLDRPSALLKGTEPNCKSWGSTR